MKASKIKARPVEWLWKEHVPFGMLTVICGAPDKGKSTLALKIVADTSNEGIPCWISSYEEPMAEVIRPKLDAAGADLDLIEVRKLSFPYALKDNSPFRRAVENDGVQLLVLDTVSDNTAASIYNVRQIRDALGPLVEYADSVDLAVVAVTHSIKKVDIKADPLAALGGSQGGLGAMARAAYVWGYSAEDEDERVLAQLKCNVASRRKSLAFEMDVKTFEDGISAPYLTYLGETPQRAVRTFTALPDGVDPKKIEAAAEFLINTLRDGHMPEDRLVSLAEAAQMSFRKVRIAADEIGCTYNRGVWKLPDVQLEANVE